KHTQGKPADDKNRCRYSHSTDSRLVMLGLRSASRGPRIAGSSRMTAPDDAQSHGTRTNRLEEKRKHARVPVEAIVADFAVGKEPHQREVAEGVADGLQFLGIVAEQVRAVSHTGAIDTALDRLVAGTPSDIVEHALQVLLSASAVPA